MTLVLGSSSRWRQLLFRRHFPEQHTDFVSPDIDEKAIRDADAQVLTRLIANAKADALVERLGRDDPAMCAAGALLICMDQVVRCEGVIREKPESAQQARSFIQSYARGAVAECVNGVVVHNLRSGARVEANEIATVEFAPIPESVIDEAIAKGDIFSSAG
eukprot:3496187-Prymnesium_polylepis.1